MFDIIGDIHGCCTELEELLGLLGYEFDGAALPESVWGPGLWAHPEGRRILFLGDLCDRGLRIIDCYRIAANMVNHGNALAVCGNHDEKLRRALLGHKVTISHGLDKSLAEFDANPALRQPAIEFIESLATQLVLDSGRLVTAHGGMKEAFQGQDSTEARRFALFGDITGKTGPDGYPERLDWAADYYGQAMVVYGHTPVREPVWVNNTVNIDTGCVFGGSLSALRYPEREFVSVKALSEYARHPISFAGAGNVLD